MFQGNGSGLIFSFWVLKREKQEKKSANEQSCVFFDLPVLWPACCSFFAVFEVMTSSAFQFYPLLPISCEHLHYMQITTPASAFMVAMRGSTGTWVWSIVRSDRPAPGEQISEFSPRPGTLTVLRIKCPPTDPCCQNDIEPGCRSHECQNIIT